MIAKRHNTTGKIPYFEYYYSAAPEKAEGPKTLIVSFPGRKTNRLFGSSPDDSQTFLWNPLNNSDADILFVRSVYKNDPNLANITDDYDLLPGLLYDLRKRKGIDRLVLFGFSLGCAPCLWLARKHIADEAILLSPGLYSVVTLAAVEDEQWGKDFERYCNAKRLQTAFQPEINMYPQDIRMKIIQGRHLENDILKERDLVEFLEILNPQAQVERIHDVGHHIPKFWRDQGQEVLQTEIHKILRVSASNCARDNQAQSWSKLSNAFEHSVFTHGARPLGFQENRLSATL